MIALERTAAVLLAAGRSVRFGAQDKLLAPLKGQPLAAHVTGLLSTLPMLARVAVIQAAEQNARLAELLRQEGFTLTENRSPERGQGRSVRLGLARALKFDPDAVLICLADMPNVTEDHLRALASAADPERAAISATEAHRSPPALIPKSIASLILADPTGTIRSMIEPAVEVITSPWVLADIDTPADLSGDAFEP